MNFNVGSQNPGVIAWDGVTSYPRDVTGFIAFGWTFEVTADPAADAVFTVEAAPGSDADPCVPGAFAPVEEIVICSGSAVPGALAEIVIPAGTPAGSICSGTLPCKPGKFVQLVPGAGAGAVKAVLVYHGPK